MASTIIQMIITIVQVVPLLVVLVVMLFNIVLLLKMIIQKNNSKKEDDGIWQINQLQQKIEQIKHRMIVLLFLFIVVSAASGILAIIKRPCKVFNPDKVSSSRNNSVYSENYKNK